MQEPRPDIHHIQREDLVSQERLADLYIEAVRRDYWPNTLAAALEFTCLAEKALHDDKQNNRSLTSDTIAPNLTQSPRE